MLSEYASNSFHDVCNFFFQIPLMSLGSRIRAIRKWMGESQKVFGARFGVTSQAVSQRENDTNPPKSEHLIEISQQFNVDHKWLVHGAGTAPGFLTGAAVANTPKDQRNDLIKKIQSLAAELTAEQGAIDRDTLLEWALECQAEFSQRPPEDAMKAASLILNKVLLRHRGAA